MRILKAITVPAVAVLVALVPLMSQVSAAQIEKTLYTFTGGNDGANPWGGLAVSGGNLYGSAAFGGTVGCGVVFEMKLTNGKWKESVIHSFASVPDGCTADGNVAADASGNIYGTTQNGGTGGDGTAYRVSRAANGTWTEEVLYSFNNVPNDGNTPFSGVILDAAGNVYGTTVYGGGKGYKNGCMEYGGCGTIFKLTPNGNSWTETVLYRFTGGTDGAFPNGLTLDSKGVLYGTAGGGGTSGYAGTVFRLVPSGTSWKFQPLYSFTGNNDGAYPAGAVAVDSSGNVYGTAYGGLYGAGVIFEIVKPAVAGTQWSEETLYSFTGNSDGAGPQGGVIFDTKGNLYGTTQGVEAFNNFFGSVFRLQHSKSTWTLYPLYDFTGGNDGDTPFAGVIFGPGGELYGANSGLQGNGVGAVYAVTP
jgi:hypothetical protein